MAGEGKPLQVMGLIDYCDLGRFIAPETYDAD
jgi:hypothetical protein